MTELLENSGQSNPTPGAEAPRGNDKNMVSREEFNKVVSQRDRAKDELKVVRANYDETERVKKLIDLRLETEHKDKDVMTRHREEVEKRLHDVKSQFSSERERLEGQLKEAQKNLEASQKRIDNFISDMTLADEEKNFLDAAKNAAYSHQNAEILYGYLRGRGRLRSVPFEDKEKAIKGQRQEALCNVPDENGKLEKRFLSLEEAMPYLKQENKMLAPALAPSGGQGSVGSDGSFIPGVLDLKTMTLAEYKANRNPKTGQVFVR